MTDSLRRDPRSEWIARNRLHPLHASMQPLEASWVGLSGLIRKNPHALGFAGPNGLKRIDRSGAQQGGSRQRARVDAAVQLPLHIIEQPAFHIVVVPDMIGGRLSSHDKDLFGLANTLAGSEGAVVAVVFGEHKESAFDTAGIDRLLHISSEAVAGYSPEQRVMMLRAVDAQLAPRHWLIPDSRTGGGELGRRLAAKLGERPATRVWQMADGQCVGRAGGGQQDLVRRAPRLILAAAECADPVGDTRHEVRAIELEDVLVHGAARLDNRGAVAVDPALTPMAEAEFILSGGNGVRDWDLFHQAARELGATEGASRVAVDDGFMPRDRQVGATGTWVTARVYLAVGISGAVQHLQGIATCDKVVAINQDAGCDMVKRADLAVIGDSTAILQALIDRVDALRQGGIRDAA
ncbi:electron transfer flavoprotein subunit alpha/FixB family protein [Halomonas halodenitrificans]|uniref:electron transfer flavoprotein subunit alpha n=1 Tax=Halomonas halodenitrificans TaxID=28252 RepID=UPI00048450E2|nr:electron transfer flavoprotein subunit alpha/FixB family protein [Halomonas halodenitrificans]